MIEMMEYGRDVFPIAGVLEDLTNDVREARIEPFEAYTHFRRELGRLGIGGALDYLSTSITSGGHARVPGADMGTIIESNTRTGRLLTAHLEATGALQAEDAILLVDLGKTGWNQVGFMKFWSMVISGIDTPAAARRPQGLSQLETQIESAITHSETDLFAMAESRLDSSVRREQYYHFVSAFAELVMSGRVEARPVHRFIKLVDTKVSLGCDAEAKLARRLNIPTLRLTPMKPATEQEVASEIPLLDYDLSVISAYDGEVTVAAKGSALMLTRE